MDLKKVFFVFTALIIVVNGFGSAEDKFIKKYAMMKIYESCFGPEVVKQIRREMKAACMKCANMVVPSASSDTKHLDDSENISGTSKHDPTQSEVTTEHSTKNPVKPSFDPEKLHHAILAYRPNPFQPSFRPFSSSGFYQGFANAPQMMYPGFAGGVPFPQAFPQFPPFLPSFVGNQRMSREMDMKNQFESLTARMTGKVKNITCVMQELGYLNDKLEPNFEGIQAKIDSLAIPVELKQDMKDGVSFCQQFSQCVPEIKKDKSPLSNELVRPMFFFRCYKHKKLEACIMKDVRERLATDGEENLKNEEPDFQMRRTGKSINIDNNEIDEISSYVYEFLYGGELESDSFL